MDKAQSQKIIRETFESKFDRARFIRFIVELLNLKLTAVAEAGVTFNLSSIPNTYQPFINSFEKITDYKSGEAKLDVLIIRLNKETSIERARTMQRNFIAWYLRGGCDGEQKDAALAAFVSPDENDWRFSLIKMDYSLIEDKKGAGKIIELFTPAKRWSFLVGSNERSHTAQAQLVDIFEMDEADIALAQLEEAFNVEKVAKEFFNKYRELFFQTKEELDEILLRDNKIRSDFEEKNINTADFTKKLLGQIVFLYFLQKKGWFGVARDTDWGTGPKNFLRELFEGKHGKYNNFFNDILELLFYEALRIDRSANDDYYDKFNCKIPFLNGGLFDPIGEYDWVHTDINLPDKLFSNSDKNKEGDTGTGILDIFDRYNFTVKEDEPLEKEVAVDPEMLGKVFENLLEIKDRKSKGTYYTPREIVHYMCQQSLINYLATELEEKASKDDIEKLVKYGDQFGDYNIYLKDVLKDLPVSITQNYNLIDSKLDDIKICDPAVGSGAFIVGMMAEIVRTRNVLSNYIKDLNRTIYNFKRDCIENSLYGVDIDSGAVEIAKLRLWLSLVVDEEDIKQIKPLPNLDYKIMQGNSLIELLSGEFLAGLIGQRTIELVNKLKKSKDELFNITTHSQKKLKRQEIDGLIKELFEHNRTLIVDGLRQKIRGIQNQGRLFEEAKFEAEDKKRIEGIEDKIREFQKIEIPGPSEHFEWHINFSEVFQEKSGFDVIIANPPYIDSESMVNSGQEDIRAAIQESYKWTRGNWDIYIAFFELGFKELNQKGTLAFISPDKWISKSFGDEFRKGIIDNIFTILRAGRKIFENAKVDSIISLIAKKKHERLKIMDFINGEFIFLRSIDKKILLSPFTLDYLFSDKLNLLLKIEKFNNRFSDYCKAENACATSDAYKLEPYIFDLKVNSFDPIKHLKIINTGTISKYHSRWGKREMTYLGNKYLYPVVKKNEFLIAFKNSYANKSAQPKIIIKGLNLLDGCLDSDGSVIPGKTTLIIIDNDIKKLKFLLAVINCKLSYLYIKEKYPAASYNQGTSFTKEMINNFPIPEMSDAKKKEIINLIDDILVITGSEDYLENFNNHEKVKAYEKLIDQMLYELYGLTPEEIEIVESGSRK